MAYDITILLDGLILVFLCVTIFYAARLSLFMKSFREGRSEMERLIKDLSKTSDKAEAAIGIMKQNAKLTEEEIRDVINEAKFLSDELRFMNETGDSLADRLEKLADRNRELVDLMENSGGIGTQRIEPYQPSTSTKTELKSDKAKQDRSKQDKARQGKVSPPFITESFEIDDIDLDAFDMDDDDEFDFQALADGAYRQDEAEDALSSQSIAADETRLEQEPERKSFHQSLVDTEAKSKVRSFAIFDREYEDDDDDELMTAVENDDFEDDVFEAKGDKKFHSRAEQDLYEALQRKKRDYDKEQASKEAKHPKRVSKLT